MKTRKFVVPSKPSVADAGTNIGEERPHERRTLGLRYASDAQGSDLSR